MPTMIATPVSQLEDLMHLPLSEIVRKPEWIARLKRDVQVTMASPQMPVEQVRFTVTLSAGFLDLMQPDVKVSVPVLVFDEFGNHLPVKQYLLSNHGESITDTVDLPIVDRSKLRGTSDKGRTVFVFADPLNAISEQTDQNNLVSAYVYTLG